MSEEKLLPCPWCGKQPKMDNSIKGAESVYSCCVTEYMSKQMWNTRQSSANNTEDAGKGVNNGK